MRKVNESFILQWNFKMLKTARKGIFPCGRAVSWSNHPAVIILPGVNRGRALQPHRFTFNWEQPRPETTLV